MVKKIQKNSILLATLAVLLLAGGALILFMTQSGNADIGQNRSTERQTAIDYSPGTSEEQAEADQKKDESVDQQNQNGSTDSSGSVPVIITYAAQNDDIIDVNAYTSHYAAGTCTMTFTKGGATVTKQTTATPDASTTICANPLIPADEFPSKGTWQLKVTYNSNGKKGSSDTQSIVIE